MRARRLIPLLALSLLLLSAPRPAAASVQLGLGADWIRGGNSDFNLTLGLDSYLARYLSVGGRAGVAFFEDGDTVAVPIDFKLGLHIERIYFEGLVGPWMLFDSDNLFHVHLAFGFGFESRSLSGGLEVGRIEHATMVGLKVAIKL
jgi:hypothetical protein